MATARRRDETLFTRAVSVGKPNGKRPLGRLRGNIKIGIQ